MSQHVHILSLLLFLFIFVSMNQALACGSHDDSHAAKFHDNHPVEIKESTDRCLDSQDACSQSHPGLGCPPDDDDCGHCHCPDCGAITGVQVILSVISFPVFLQVATTRQAFYYTTHLPEEALPAIWQPPQ